MISISRHFAFILRTSRQVFCFDLKLHIVVGTGDLQYINFSNRTRMWPIIIQHICNFPIQTFVRGFLYVCGRHDDTIISRQFQHLSGTWGFRRQQRVPFFEHLGLRILIYNYLTLICLYENHLMNHFLIIVRDSLLAESSYMIHCSRCCCERCRAACQPADGLFSLK